MSGGVDSSVTAVLLKNQGYQVLGCHLVFSDPLPPYVPRDSSKKKKGKYFLGGEESEEQKQPAHFRTHCVQGPRPEEVQAICTRFDIPYYEIDARMEFEAVVIDPAIHDILQLRKPNPCNRCSSHLKMMHLIRKADELGCDFIATGHYAQIVYESADNLYQLRRAIDASKDQTFDLSGLSQKTLSRCLMPLGGLSQGMVRKLAEEFNFTSRRPAKNGVCFVDSEECGDFVEDRTAPSLRTPGVIRTADGEVVGEHAGLFRFKLGQTEGMDLSMREVQDKWCVVGFEPRANVLIVGKEEDLMIGEFRVSNVNWVTPVDELRQIQCRVRVQSQTEEITASVFCFENKMAHVRLDKRWRAVNSGERVVFYDADRVMGGGTVERMEEVVSGPK